MSRRSSSSCSVLLLVLCGLAWHPVLQVQASNTFNRSAHFEISVVTKKWSNYLENGGCVTCPYSCVKPMVGPDGAALNASNVTAMEGIPSIYSQPVMNGCCYASKAKSDKMPSCNNEAQPKTAEDCGFLYGPELSWRISSAPDNRTWDAILFASTDCMHFWAVGHTPVRRWKKDSSVVSGTKMINGGCYGSPNGAAMVLAGCLTEMMKFDKAMQYSWDMLAQKCYGLSGICAITNGMWRQHLSCCTNLNDRDSDWDLTYKEYKKEKKTGLDLPGPAICAIVFGGVCLMLCMVHFGAKARERARQTALMREQEATDDYEEIMTPLTGASGDKRPVATTGRSMGPSSLEVSLQEGDKIFRKQADEVLFEGDL